MAVSCEGASLRSIRDLTTMCAHCDSVCPDITPEPLSAMRRKAVRRRFFNLFETYECRTCGANWERVVLTPDKHPVTYGWTRLSDSLHSADRTNQAHIDHLMDLQRK